jgi:hypothetical protein
MAHETSIWAWRKDLERGVQTTYDLSGDQQHSIYGGCWRSGGVDTVGDAEVEDGVKFVEMTGETGLTLFNKRKAESWQPGCLMRQSRQQIDLSVIGRMELDIKVTGQGTSYGSAPWYSVWLVPMHYSDTDASGKAAEIDLLENYNQAAEQSKSDANGLATNFAQCGIDGYTLPYCKRSVWFESATDVDHHITLKAHEDQDGHRVFEVRRCRNTGAPMETCNDGDFAQIQVQKPAYGIDNWFPIWNRDVVGDDYAKYWLAADMWYTSETDFTLGVDNVRFFTDDDTEWKMPLDYGGDEAAPQETLEMVA